MTHTIDDIIIDEKPISDHYPYLSRIIFNNGLNYTCIIDNVYPKWIAAYNLSQLSTYHIDEKNLCSIIDKWHTDGSIIPVSIFFEQQGMKPYISNILNHFNMKNIKSITGPVYSFNQKPKSVKKIRIASNIIHK